MAVLSYGFDRVGNNVATLERIAHAGGSHGDAIADSDGVESVPNQACLLDTLFDLGGQVVQMHVARVSLVPTGRYRGYRLKAKKREPPKQGLF